MKFTRSRITDFQSLNIFRKQNDYQQKHDYQNIEIHQLSQSQNHFRFMFFFLWVVTPSVLFGPRHRSSPSSPLRSSSVHAIDPLRSSPSGLFFPRQRPSSVLTIASGKHKPVTKSCFNKLDGITMLKIKMLKLKSLVS